MKAIHMGRERRQRLVSMVRYVAGLGLALGLLSPYAASAQSYPSKPIKMISPYTAGGLSDTVARGFAEKLSEVLGVAVVVENRPGAGTTVATKSVMASAPDGYTIYCGTTSLVINPALQDNAGYDWKTAVAPVALMMTTPFVLHTNLNLPVKNARELTDLIKANPGKYSYGSSGNGAVNHMAGELWKSKAGLQMTHVPYKGGMTAATDMIGGNIHMMFSAVLEAKPMIDAGKTKAIAVSSAKRIDVMPQLPTLAESLGMPSLVAEFWMGLYVPPATPQPVIDKLAASIQKIAADPAFRERFAKQGVTVRSSTTQELKDFMEQEARQWTDIIRANNIKS